MIIIFYIYGYFSIYSWGANCVRRFSSDFFVRRDQYVEVTLCVFPNILDEAWQKKRRKAAGVLLTPQPSIRPTRHCSQRASIP